MALPCLNFSLYRLQATRQDLMSGVRLGDVIVGLNSRPIRVQKDLFQALDNQKVRGQGERTKGRERGQGAGSKGGAGREGERRGAGGGRDQEKGQGAGLEAGAGAGRGRWQKGACPMPSTVSAHAGRGRRGADAHLPRHPLTPHRSCGAG